MGCHLLKTKAKSHFFYMCRESQLGPKQVLSWSQDKFIYNRSTPRSGRRAACVDKVINPPKVRRNQIGCVHINNSQTLSGIKIILLKFRFFGSTPRISDSKGLGWAQKFTFLSISQVLTMLLIHSNLVD